MNTTSSAKTRIARTPRSADATQLDRARFVDRQFSETVQAMAEPSQLRRDWAEPLHDGTDLSCRDAVAMFRSQVESRLLDLQGRILKGRGEGYYTIGSSGHEGNAAVAAAARPSDPAMLHYRSGAFYLQRSRQLMRSDEALSDVLLGMVAAADEPVSGGRHKVFGHPDMAIWPQTSTIGSQLPKATGMAFALARCKRLGIPTETPKDGIIISSFGDASANHSTSIGAINAACWSSFQGQPTPVLFVCEDNGVGISVTTPAGWIHASYSSRPGLRYLRGDGRSLDSAYDAARSAVDYVRRERRPAFLHLRTVRLMGHAGSDLEATYRPIEGIEQTERQDPVLATALLLLKHHVAAPKELLEIYESTRSRIAELAETAIARPKLTKREEVMAPLAAVDQEAIEALALAGADGSARQAFWNKLPESERPQPLGVSLNRALGDLLVQHPELLIFGEDVGVKGGVYGVTRGLSRRARRGRVFDTLLDEQSILGLAIGAGQLGCIPIPEIQYLAYLHNAEDQLRGEAASMQFFSKGQFRNPMVVRIAAYAYQKGFGGHFHNDNALAVLRDIPGLIIASPAHPTDAVGMLRTCVAAAKESGSVCVFLEPIALYPVRDLYTAGDGAWTAAYQPSSSVALGEGRRWTEGSDLLIVSWANGLYMSLRAAKRLEAAGIRCRVFDLRWLSPLPRKQLLDEAKACSKVLVVDETRRSGGVSEGIITALVEDGFDGPIRRIAASDSFVPLGDAANLVLVQEEEIEQLAKEMCTQSESLAEN